MTTAFESRAATAPVSAQAVPDCVEVGSLHGGLALELSPRDTGARMPVSDLFDTEREKIKAMISRFGGVLLRGFAVDDALHFKNQMNAFGKQALNYTERSTPRKRVAESLYTATEYPAREPIFLHNENAYASQWPSYIAFYCECPAQTGGAMIVADMRKVYARVPSNLRTKCERVGLLYTRRFFSDLGYSWQEAYGVDNETDLMNVLSSTGYTAEWDNDRLIVQRRAAWIINHPECNVPVWFNHGIFFNSLSLPDSTRRAFESLFGKDNFPYQTSFGDGESIDKETYATVRSAHENELISIQLKQGDVLLLDNLLSAHGREAYTGARRHYVVMLD